LSGEAARQGASPKKDEEAIEQTRGKIYAITKPSTSPRYHTMSSFLHPTKKSSQNSIKPKAVQKPNPIRAIREREERRQAIAAAAAAAAASQSSISKQSPGLAVASRPQCPNKSCEKPNVVDGICQTCGRIADDSNIVAEVQFGETSSGAAVVQGSYIGADQAGVRSMGPAFRRVGGSEDREKSIREARSLMQGYAQQLNLSDTLVNAGVQVFKLASNVNFIQGRGIIMVAAACLYAACRNEPPCKIMLLDLADLTHVNVFRLGRCFKALNKAVPMCNDGMVPVYPEDLIYRFASKLEFLNMTSKVAETAVRLVRRMSRDWMVMGRRPSGICGACLLMAARLHNFRRTVREVVYIVKVTTQTIQNRLQEFTFTESSHMTVEDFLTQDFLESSHDPPSFYKKSEDYQNIMKERSRKRKRRITDGGDDELESSSQDGIASRGADSEEQIPQRSTADDEIANSASSVDGNGPQPSASSTLDLSSLPPVEYRRDADGFIIPPLPPKPNGTDLPLLEADSTEALNALAREHGDLIVDEEDLAAPNRDDSPAGNQGKQPAAALQVDDEWENDEVELETEISEIMNDPETLEHAKAFSTAEQRAHIHTMWALQQRPLKHISMAQEVGEDEFADDPEVQNCVLSAEESKIKELLWVNENKDWMRLQQEKVFRKKMEADRPKATRKRKKKPRIGEGQTSPASTPGEAAVNAMKERAWSKRINYDAIRSIFDIPNAAGPGSAMGSDANSRITSRAGSTAGGDGSQREDSPMEDDDLHDDESAVEDDAEEYGDEDTTAFDNDEDNYGEADDDD
jgi:transcription factor IIIB 90 kDa subunit